MEKEDELGRLVGRIPVCASQTPELHCCCGSVDCAYLKHNSVALEQLEGEIRTAGQLGQALLARHEQYMHDAERDRLEMNAKIERLEEDKKDLEAVNAKTIEENRELLDQLEELNGGVAESETHIKSLEATLQSTRMELKRLEILASRTLDLEMQLATLEQEQETLQKTIILTEEQERSAIQRWRKAERRLSDLQEQLDRIDREAREERERHVEVLGRMERQRAVERELDTAAGRLKGAAAATTGTGKNGSNVVSHFVKDILQDNANLQLGIVELREMLMNSNDEVQMLREQLLLHQPVEEKEGESGPPTLKAELSRKDVPEPQVVSQALHIHHHYHAPKKEEVRRPKKKRTSINTALFTPPKGMQSPRGSRIQDTTNTILAQTAVSIPGSSTPDHRWSMQSGQMSDFAPSSVPSSPQSMYRHSALFDRGFEVDSSRPTSPGSSVDPMSPAFNPHYHRKRGSEVSARSFIPAAGFQPHIIHEEEDHDVEEIPDLQASSVNEDVTSDTSREPEYLDQEDWSPASQPKLHRSTSHESILSISGIDIHTLKSRPSQLTITRGNALLPTRPALSTVSMDTVTSSSFVTARPTLSRQGHDSTSYLRSRMLANGIPINTDNQSVSSGNSSHSNPNSVDSSGVSSRLGGWVFGRWGVSPAKSVSSSSNNNLRPPPAAAARAQYRAVSTPAAPVVDPMKAFFGRSPGINQKGPIPGFTLKNERAPSQVKPQAVDHDALREVLADGIGS